MHIKNNIKNHALSKDEEVCGFIVQDDEQIKIYPIENVAENKKNNFVIPTKDYLYVDQKFEVLAVYHSHVDYDESPSELDRKTCEAVYLPYVIYSKKTKKFEVCFPEGFENKEKIKKILNENENNTAW